jgi:hypothetical protein
VDSEYHIFSVTFGEEEMEIVYYESRHDTPERGMRKIQTDLIAKRLFPDHLESIHSELEEILREAHREWVNPQRTLPPVVEDDDE